MEDAEKAADVALTFLEGTLNAADFDIKAAVVSWLEGFSVADTYRELRLALSGFAELDKSEELRRKMDVSERSWEFYSERYTSQAIAEIQSEIARIEKTHPEVIENGISL
ncbi:MAG: hypothetical protein WBP23_00455 [Candidatus Saccharimonadales bacterium]